MNREGMDHLREGMEASAKKADAKAAERRKKAIAKNQWRSTQPKTKTRAELKAQQMDNGEPTTAAIEAWGPREFRALFNKAAAQHSRFKEGPIVRDIASVAKFIEQLRAYAREEAGIDELAPRAVYRVIKSAATKLVRYRKQTDMKKPVGLWMMLTIGYDIINDHASMLYGRDSFKFMLTEDVDSREVKIENVDECVVLSHARLSDGLLLHRDKLHDNVLNPELRARLQLDADGAHDDTEEYEDPDGTGIHL